MKIDHYGIRKIMPHRHPLLLVDQIISYEMGKSIVGIKTVTGTESCYSELPDSAPPEAYAYPLSLMMESFGQTGGILINMMREEKSAPKDVVMLAAGCTSFKVLKTVYPGDVMEHHAVLDKEMDDFALIGGVIKVRGEVVAEIEAMIVAYRAQNNISQGKI